MDLPFLAFGLILLGGVSAWLLADWRVRSARSVLLLSLSLATVVAIGLTVGPPLGLPLALLVGGAVAVPVVLRLPVIMPLTPDDQDMVRFIGRTEARVVAAGERFRRGALTAAAYREQLDRVKRDVLHEPTPDHGWRRLLEILADDIDKAVRQVAGAEVRGRSDILAGRSAFRSEYARLVRERLRFWR